MLEDVITRCEAEEFRLSYDRTVSEASRKLSGSYYTPADVARRFWRDFLCVHEVADAASALEFVRGYHFIEPAAGSGILFFTLLDCLVELGVSVDDASQIRTDLVDINLKAVGFIEDTMIGIRSRSGLAFSHVNVVHADFMTWKAPNRQRPKLFFGNPPFVGICGSRWKNTAEAFFEKSIEDVGEKGAINFVMPLSISFSRDYSRIRKGLLSGMWSVCVSHFDNIPDTLFKSGKPESTNTNKANSQRCSIVGLINDGRRRRLTTQLHAWSRRGRAEFMSASSDYVEFESYAWDDQIPRLASGANPWNFEARAVESRTLASLLDEQGPFDINLGGVARNFIGIREVPSAGSICLRVRTRKDFMRVLGLLASRKFFRYWKTVGDGFHVTRTTVLSFPLDEAHLAAIDQNLPKIRKMWRERRSFMKEKLNRGQVVRTYDFTPVDIP